MAVFCTDRASSTVFGAPSRVWGLTGAVLTCLDAELVPLAWTVDGHVPSWLARSWGALLFDALGDVVLVCRPVPGRGPDLVPVGVYREGSPAAADWVRAGEPLSVYDTPLAPGLLAFAQWCTTSSGFTVTTLRPPAPGTAPSEVAVRRLLARSGLLRDPHARRQHPRPQPLRPSAARTSEPHPSGDTGPRSTTSGRRTA